MGDAVMLERRDMEHCSKGSHLPNCEHRLHATGNPDVVHNSPDPLDCSCQGLRYLQQVFDHYDEPWDEHDPTANG